MNIVDIIRKKRDGERLSAEEIRFLVKGIVRGEVEDSQAGAFLMAVYFSGLSAEETSALTMEMAESGDMLDLSAIPGTVDKHSTGGVGDKTTLVVAPLAAAAGVPVAKLSGRALGHTSGTIDRLESIPGLRTDLSTEEFIAQVKSIGVAVSGQTARLVPADKKIYALRDKTATVEVIPLIAASVMSKKLAGGAQSILLDVKCGRGAFVPELERAKQLAETMVKIGKSAGRKTRALVTAMDQPLGRAVGEGLEMGEAVETLRGGGPADFLELCLLVASHMVYLGGKSHSPESARITLERLLGSGAALEKLRQMVSAQGGDVKTLERPEELGRTRHQAEVRAPKSGYVQRIDARAIGDTARSLVNNHTGGILLERKAGDEVISGGTLAVLLSDDSGKLEEASVKVEEALTIGEEPPKPTPLLLCPPIG
jgi:pyrimidine-nucleoside phosphorylase